MNEQRLTPYEFYKKKTKVLYNRREKLFAQIRRTHTKWLNDNLEEIQVERKKDPIALR